MHAYRSHTCVDLTAVEVGQNIRLSGWVHRRRDHGGVIFIDLRDTYGMTQVLCDPDSPVFSEAENSALNTAFALMGLLRHGTQNW